MSPVLRLNLRICDCPTNTSPDTGGYCNERSSPCPASITSRMPEADNRLRLAAECRTRFSRASRPRSAREPVVLEPYVGRQLKEFLVGHGAEFGDVDVASGLRTVGIRLASVRGVVSGNGIRQRDAGIVVSRWAPASSGSGRGASAGADHFVSLRKLAASPAGIATGRRR